jgi:putative CocE/NonD family hydrolase
VLARRAAPAHPHGAWADEQLAFLGRHLAGEGEAEAEPSAPVRIFVMGANVWRDEPAWPLARAVGQRWHLRPGGVLSHEEPEPGGAPPSTYNYDPRDPVPTHGGPFLASPGWPPGPMEQSAIEARPDVLTFTSPVLEHDLEVTGRVRAVLHAASSAPSADWVVRLCDVDPAGRSYCLCDGIARVAAGADAVHRVEVDLWSTSNVFLAGHRLRVQVTSSNFPRWDRNLGTGRQHEPAMVTAHQRLFHDAQRPSWLELPVVAG